MAGGPGVRDQYRPAEFEAERYSPDNLSLWTPILIRLARIRHDDDVLDLGCATGGLTSSITEASGARLVGCDHSRALLQYGRHAHDRSSTQWVCADGARLPFRSSSFDRVMASLVLHQVPNRVAVLDEVTRTLRPGGLLLVRTVTPETAMRWIPHRFFPSIARAQADRMPSIRELTELIESAGLSPAHTETVIRRRHLHPDQVERVFRREVADRYPFVTELELNEGLRRMRHDWETRRGDWIDDRRFEFLTAQKPSD